MMAPESQSSVAMVERVEQPRALDVPAASPLARDVPESEEALVTGDDLGVLTHGVLAGLGISVPLWLGIAWLVIRLAATLPLR